MEAVETGLVGVSSPNIKVEQVAESIESHTKLIDDLLTILTDIGNHSKALLSDDLTVVYMSNNICSSSSLFS